VHSRRGDSWPHFLYGHLQAISPNTSEREDYLHFGRTKTIDQQRSSGRPLILDIIDDNPPWAFMGLHIYIFFKKCQADNGFLELKKNQSLITKSENARIGWQISILYVAHIVAASGVDCCLTAAFFKKRLIFKIFSEVLGLTFPGILFSCDCVFLVSVASNRSGCAWCRHGRRRADERNLAAWLLN